MNSADAVTKGGAIVAARAPNWSMMNGKDDRVALVRSEHFDARLAARLLLREHKFAAVKIPSPLAQKEGDLKRKQNLTVQILVQAIEITRTVLQHQRRRPILACAVTLLREKP